MKRKAFTAYYDAENGELIDIVFSDRFQAENLLLRADILQDALGEITRLYDAAAAGMRRDFERLRARALASEKGRLKG